MPPRSFWRWAPRSAQPSSSGGLGLGVANRGKSSSCGGALALLPPQCKCGRRLPHMIASHMPGALHPPMHCSQDTGARLNFLLAALYPYLLELQAKASLKKGLQ